MDSITSDMDRVDTSTMVNIFIGLGLKPEDLVHPYGPVDLLIGVNYASMHHYHDAVPRVDGEMRLLRSNFGTGWVLEGYHPQISLSSVYVNQLAYRRVCSVPTKTRRINTVSTARPTYDFLDLAEVEAVEYQIKME